MIRYVQVEMEMGAVNMAHLKSERRFDSHNVPPGKLGPLDNGMANEQSKMITIRPLLDEADEAEKRIFRKR